jgi:hypothetical protein
MYLGVIAASLVLASAASAQDAQTIQPGMSEDEVRAEFGNPDGTRTRGSFTFYFYVNGCEETCGWPDVVFFQTGQVVDAILRAPWRDYGGASSSPKGTVPQATPGGERLEIPTQVESIEVRPARRDTVPPQGG